MLIPVLDLRGGRAVRAVGGRRAEYTPFDADPLTLARELVGRADATTLYVADLDAIQGVGSNRALWETWPRELGVVVVVDAGLRALADVEPFPDAVVPILASETLTDLHGTCRRATVFSVDASAGQLLGAWQVWRGVAGPGDVVGMAVAGQAHSDSSAVILLDLARVGERGGPAEDNIVAVRAALPSYVQLWVGGGVRDRADVRRLGDLGVVGVLVSTALHDGRLP